MQPIDFGAVNWPAVGVAGGATFMLGGVWYTALFGKVWPKASRLSEEQMNALHAERPPAVFFSVLIACYMVMALVLALVVQGAGAAGAGDGLRLGVCLAILVAVATLTNHMASNRDHLAYAIDVSYQSISLIGMCTLLGAWQ